MKQMFRIITGSLIAGAMLAAPIIAYAADPLPVATYQPTSKPRVDPAGALREAQRGIGKGDVNALVNGAKNGNIQQTATRTATNRGSNAASTALAGSTGLGKGNANALVNGAKNGNIQQTATRIATNNSTNAASSALAGSTGINKGNANALVNGAKNGNIQQTATRIATREVSKEISKATGGLAGSLLGGKGGDKNNANFTQKNDYVAASDDGSIASSNGGGGNGGGSGNLSQDLAKLGFGAASKLIANPQGIIKTATGEVVGRIDQKTGKLFDAAGKEIAGNTLQAMRIKESLAANKSSAPEPAPVADTSGIPAGFGNPAWSAEQRTLEWSKLLYTQQAAWVNEAAVKKAAAAANNQKLTATNNGSERDAPRT